MQEKAKYTEPCSRCGYCCAASLCPAAEIAFPEALAPCPALFIEDDKACCGLVLMEHYITGGNLVGKALGIGCGCSCPDKTTTEDEIEEHDRKSYEKMYCLCEEDFSLARDGENNIS